jgi:hypothetical protein
MHALESKRRWSLTAVDKLLPGPEAGNITPATRPINRTASTKVGAGLAQAV